MTELNIDQILSCTTVKIVKVDVEEWAGFVYVKCMTGTEKDIYETEYREASNSKDKSQSAIVRARFLAHTMCNIEGLLLCTPAQVEALGNLSSTSLDVVLKAAQSVNAMGSEELEEIEKNLERGQSEDSYSG